MCDTNPREATRRRRPGRAGGRGALRAITAAALAVALSSGCELGEPVPNRDFTIDYRTGNRDWDYTSSGERGTVNITEVNWAGSVEGTLEDGWTHHPGDVFVEIQNRYSRPVYLTGWQLIVETSQRRNPYTEVLPQPDRSIFTYIIPERDPPGPIFPNEFVVIAASRDGAFPEADFVIPELAIPNMGFRITLMDLDERLIEDVGSDNDEPFAGAWDLVSTRSMERVQLLFANRGTRATAWHSYSNNPWTEDHERLGRRIAPAFRSLTLASPGVANSVDYSGNNSAGDLD